MAVASSAITGSGHDQAQCGEEKESTSPDAGGVVEDAQKKGSGRGDEIADGLSHPGQGCGLAGTSGTLALEAQGEHETDTGAQPEKSARRECERWKEEQKREACGDDR
ncbi:hypothetical protein ACFW95_44800 [Streptomyces sp. NPDC059474]|uniref:hypothetical protein n=1 Tax=unclassified Streptomyces TaxID=2593676 RepID=UPI0033F231C9